MISGRFWRKRTALGPLFYLPNCSGVFGITGDANRRNAVSGGVFRDARREYRGRQALCGWVQGRQRTAGVKGQSPYYTVKRGDTLWGIANTYGVTLTALLNVNPQIKNPNRIAVGERVTLP